MSSIQAKKRQVHPLAVSNFSKSRFGGSSASKSTVNLKGVFAAPPNAHLKPRNYEGELVDESPEFYGLNESILTFQGHRRFKASHFKTKYVLYEDHYIQIGFKTSQIYEKVDKFSALLLFELYFGNKSASTMTHFNIQFRGDKRTSFCNVRKLNLYEPASDREHNLSLRPEQVRTSQHRQEHSLQPRLVSAVLLAAGRVPPHFGISPQLHPSDGELLRDPSLQVRG
jgi:hypothetical protein